eukprot:GFYU01058925.1.p1 GENE.GFYU01058925.1~~GFYU01058925.1.p1  ORF type:complete len:335 (+),score=87.96 GFYU01058925.1:104-1006(+)
MLFLKREDPDAYYFRFTELNDAGECDIKFSDWTKEEERVFMKHLKTTGIQKKTLAQRFWGLFSIPIPGRPGYQCWSFYQTLVKQRKVTDPYYNGRGVPVVVDPWSEEASAIERHYVHRLKGCTNVLGERKIPKPSKKNQNSSSGNKDDDKDGKRPTKKAKTTLSGSTSGDNSASSSASAPSSRARVSRPRVEKKPKKAKKKKAMLEPPSVGLRLPGVMDVMTQDLAVNPAISPYGHVLGYWTWCRVLNGTHADQDDSEDEFMRMRNTCPFTKLPLTRRQLCKLTEDNINEYRDKIVTPWS